MDRRRHVGIIPARAGFTTQPSMNEWTQGDHPRSRGVYFLPGINYLLWAGSSPLARGLLRLSLRQIFRIRDHPRSRGVY